MSSTEGYIGVGVPVLAVLGQESLWPEFFRAIPVLGIAVDVVDMYVDLGTLGQDEAIVQHRLLDGLATHNGNGGIQAQGLLQEVLQVPQSIQLGHV